MIKLLYSQTTEYNAAIKENGKNMAGEIAQRVKALAAQAWPPEFNPHHRQQTKAGYGGSHLL